MDHGSKTVARGACFGGQTMELKVCDAGAMLVGQIMEKTVPAGACFGGLVCGSIAPFVCWEDGPWN